MSVLEQQRVLSIDAFQWNLPCVQLPPQPCWNLADCRCSAERSFNTSFHLQNDSIYIFHAPLFCAPAAVRLAAAEELSVARLSYQERAPQVAERQRWRRRSRARRRPPAAASGAPTAPRSAPTGPGTTSGWRAPAGTSPAPAHPAGRSVSGDTVVMQIAASCLRTWTLRVQFSPVQMI